MARLAWRKYLQTLKDSSISLDEHKSWVTFAWVLRRITKDRICHPSVNLMENLTYVSITMFATVVKTPTRSENKIVAACYCAQQFRGRQVGFDICVQASEVPPGAWTSVFRFLRFILQITRS